MALVQSAVLWLRQSLSWSNSWPSWRERLVLLAFLVVPVALGLLTPWLQFWQAILLWAIFGIAVAVGTRQGWLQLFGPVLFYDMIRSARRTRFLVMRVMYVGALLAILLLIFYNYRRYQGDSRREAALLAELFFLWFMVVQLSLVVLLTPAYVAGAIAEEKYPRDTHNTLEFLLATDLNNHEIVLSKLLSRIANLVLFLLTGVPILSILQFVGGVDTPLMLTGFAGTGLTILGIASVSILFSTLMQKPRDAIGLTYLAIIAYVALATVGKAMVHSGVWFMAWPLWPGAEEATWADVSQALNAGNALAAIIDIRIAMDRATLATTLPEVLANYAWFHGVLALVCIVWSIARVRAVALKQAVGGTTRKRWWSGRQRPTIGELPMLWKELYIEGRLKMGWLGWSVLAVLVSLTIGSGVFIVGAFAFDFLGGDLHDRRFLGEMVNRWFRVAGTSLACLMLLMLGVRASTCISQEREHGTFDALITTPMSADAMLWAKLLGCLTSMRLAWMWLGSMIAVAVCTGGLHPLAVPILVVAWFIYGAVFVQVGMWFSMVCKSSMQATVFTMLTTLFLGGGHWLVMAMCCYIPTLSSSSRGGVENIAKLEAGLTPPIVLFFSAYSWDNLSNDFSRRELGEIIGYCILGLFLWAMAAVIGWNALVLPYFRHITRRDDRIEKPRVMADDLD